MKHEASILRVRKLYYHKSILGPGFGSYRWAYKSADGIGFRRRLRLAFGLELPEAGATTGSILHLVKNQ